MAATSPGFSRGRQVRAAWRSGARREGASAEQGAWIGWCDSVMSQTRRAMSHVRGCRLEKSVRYSHASRSRQALEDCGRMRLPHIVSSENVDNVAPAWICEADSLQLITNATVYAGRTTGKRVKRWRSDQGERVHLEASNTRRSKITRSSSCGSNQAMNRVSPRNAKRRLGRVGPSTGTSTHSAPSRRLELDMYARLPHCPPISSRSSNTTRSDPDDANARAAGDEAPRRERPGPEESNRAMVAASALGAPCRRRTGNATESRTRRSRARNTATSAMSVSTASFVSDAAMSARPKRFMARGALAKRSVNSAEDASWGSGTSFVTTMPLSRAACEIA